MQRKKIEVKNLIKKYGKGESRFKALDDVSVRIHDGEHIAILGASGSGKSTLLNVIFGPEEIDGGSVYQYALLKIMVDIVFAGVEGVPEYKFDFPVCFITVAVFLIVYEGVMFAYGRSMKRIPPKQIMSEYNEAVTKSRSALDRLFAAFDCYSEKSVCAAALNKRWRRAAPAFRPALPTERSEPDLFCRKYWRSGLRLFLRS